MDVWPKSGLLENHVNRRSFELDAPYGKLFFKTKIVFLFLFWFFADLPYMY